MAANSYPYDHPPRPEVFETERALHAVAEEQAARAEEIREHFPTPEDWIALQGGRPRVFRNPKNPNARWIVVHVYDEHPDAAHRFSNGAVIDTLPIQDSFDIGAFQISRVDEEGQPIERVVRVPRFMFSKLHGDPCSNRSGGGDRGSYERVASQSAYERLIWSYKSEGLQEMRFGMTQTGYQMQPLPNIRQPRPLED